MAIIPRTWLTDLCNASGMTRAQIADEVGISPQLLWYYEAGQRTPSLRVGLALGDTLHVDPRRFLESA